MYTNLILYRNELKNKHIYKYKLIGIVTDIILSKTVFTKNKDVNEFIFKVFDVRFKDYVIKSRTMIVAQTSRLISSSQDNSLYSKKLYNFINEKLEELKTNGDIKHIKNDFDGWIK